MQNVRKNIKLVRAFTGVAKIIVLSYSFEFISPAFDSGYTVATTDAQIYTTTLSQAGTCINGTSILKRLDRMGKYSNQIKLIHRFLNSISLGGYYNI